jgi:hypothetical protein
VTKNHGRGAVAPRSLGAQAGELLEVIESVWGRERAESIRADADSFSQAANHPRSMTRNYHVYIAAGLPMPRYAGEEFAHFLANGTELDAGRKMSPEVREWLVAVLERLRDLPPSPANYHETGATDSNPRLRSSVPRSCPVASTELLARACAWTPTRVGVRTASLLVVWLIVAFGPELSRASLVRRLG